MLTDVQNVLTDALIRIHRVITRGVEVAGQQSRACANGERIEPPLSAGFADYLHALSAVLHSHHGGEEEIIFPALRERFPEAPWELLIEEHRAVVAVLSDLDAHVEPIRQEQPEAWAAVADSLDRLAALWGPHHSREEAHFTPPAVAQRVSIDEQAALSAKAAAHGMQHAGPDYLVVPFMLFNLDGDERREMAATLPPVVTEQLVPVAWRDKWAPMKPFLFA